MPGQTHRGWRPCAVKIIPLEYYIMNQNSSIRKLVRCGVVAAIYVAVSYTHLTLPTNSRV